MDTAQSLLKARVEATGTKDTWWSLPPRDMQDLTGRPYWEQVVGQVYYTYHQIDADRDEFGAGRFQDLSYEDLCRDTGRTLAELTGTSEHLPANIDGISVLPAILGEEVVGRKQLTHEFMYWELGSGRRMRKGVRMGDWKAVQMDPRQPIELFNLAEDPYEKTDLSEKNLRKLRELKRRLKSYADEAAEANIPPNRMPKDFKTPKAWGHPD